MPTDNDLRTLFGALHSQLESDLGIARSAIEHAPTKGAASEDKWIDLLTRHLPARYQVRRAFVIDSKGAKSEQQDIVIHDCQYSPFVLNHDSAQFVPAESVYAVIEVKQTLDADAVAYASKKVASVRRLHRTSLPIKHAGGEYPAKPLHHILGGLVALESDWTPALGDPLSKALGRTDEDGQLDIGCAVSHGVFQVDYKPQTAPFVSTEESDCSLALFLLRLIASLQSIATVPCIDVMAYAKKL